MTFYEMIADAADRGGYRLAMQLLDELEEDGAINREQQAEYHAYLISSCG